MSQQCWWTAVLAGRGVTAGQARPRRTVSWLIPLLLWVTWRRGVYMSCSRPLFGSPIIGLMTTQKTAHLSPHGNRKVSCLELRKALSESLGSAFVKEMWHCIISTLCEPFVKASCYFYDSPLAIGSCWQLLIGQSIYDCVKMIQTGGCLCWTQVFLSCFPLKQHIPLMQKFRFRWKLYFLLAGLMHRWRS